MLTGKTIIVAGAAGRLGREVVTAALQAGANVVGIDRNVDAIEDLIATPNDRFRAHVGDIKEVEALRGWLTSTAAFYGSVDGAVNATYPRGATYGDMFFDVTLSSFNENVGLHLGSYFLFMQQCAKYAVERGDTFSLVSFSSIYGSIAPRFDIYEGTSMTMPVEYAAIKSGIEHLTRYVNAVAKGSRFRANCVSPGGIQAGQPKSFVDNYQKYSRTKGMLSPKDISGAVLFLLSDSSEFVVGQNIVVDDGFSL